MLKILEPTDYQNVYNLLSSKKKIFEYDYSPIGYDEFIDKMTNATTTTFFLDYDDNNKLISFLSTRTLVHIFPAWYSHLIVVQNNLPLRASWRTQAMLYDYAIQWYEENHNNHMFFYLQPTRYKICLNVPVRKYSMLLNRYKSVQIDTVKAGQKSQSMLVNSMLNQTVPKVDTEVILKIKDDKYENTPKK